LKRSNRLVLLIGIFLAIVAFVLIVLMLGNGDGGGGEARRSQAPTTAPVVVAARNVDLGATFVAADLATKDIPVDQKPADSYSDTSQVIGQIARAKVTSGQLITSVILNASGSVQNIEVPAGFVGISVQVDQVTGVGTLIKPGDFVDVVTGFTTAETVPLVVPDPATAADLNGYLRVEDALYNHTTVKFLAQGIQVIGTLLPAPPPQDTQTQESTAPDGTTTSTTLNGQQQMVILAVTAQDAEVLKFAQMDGNLSLVLRSPKDCTTKPVDGGLYCPVVATTGTTLRRLVDDRGVLPPTVVQVIQPTPLPGTVPGKTPKP
jgi:pilus assembly protein CpaB